MWYLKNIPKIMHFYWGGKPVSYLQYMSIYTFWRLNPDWEIYFHQPEVPTQSISWNTFEQKYDFTGKDYFLDIFEIPVKAKYFHFKEKFNMPDEMSEVHKSDLLRWHLLHVYGGFWSDMDILFLKPMNDLTMNNSSNSNVQIGISVCYYGHSIGFLFGCPGNKYYKMVFNSAKNNYNENDYQTMGVKTLNKFYPTPENIKFQLPNEKLINIPMDVVYSYDAMNVKDLFTLPKVQKLTFDSIGVHWYAGHKLSGDFLKRTNGGEENLFDCVMTDLIRQAPNSLIGNIKKEISSSDKILDLGCGNKKISNRFSNVTTLDAWSQCQPDVLHDMNNLPLPFEDNSFDHIFMFDVIEHLEKENGIKLLNDVKRICRKTIYLMTPLWWTENDDNTSDPNNVYFHDTFNLHKSLWELKDFEDWRIIDDSGPFENYFFGKWCKS